MKFSGLLVAAGFCSTLRFLRVVLLFNLFAATAAVEFRMDGVHTDTLLRPSCFDL